MTTRDLAGRKAFVTGGGRGIGRAIARELAGAGCDVAVSYASRPDDAEAAVRELRALGATATSCRLRLERPEDLAPAIDAAVAALGPIDLLVSNAGQDFRGAAVADTTAEELLHLMTVNALAPHALCRALIPQMRGRERADIVFLSSIATQTNGPDFAPYNMSKAALEALAFTLAKEERDHGLRVNVVAPGLTDTEMGARFLASDVPGEVREQILAGVAYGHVCRPEEVASVVHFLVGPAAAYVNGQRIYVDGGGPRL